MIFAFAFSNSASLSFNSASISAFSASKESISFWVTANCSVPANVSLANTFKRSFAFSNSAISVSTKISLTSSLTDFTESRAELAALINSGDSKNPLNFLSNSSAFLTSSSLSFCSLVNISNNDSKSEALRDLKSIVTSVLGICSPKVCRMFSIYLR